MSLFRQLMGSPMFIFASLLNSKNVNEEKREEEREKLREAWQQSRNLPRKQKKKIRKELLVKWEKVKYVYKLDFPEFNFN